MLIGLVRDSVLQCFCHTCRVPGLPAAGNVRAMSAKTLRTKQPKLSTRQKFISTEIRCQEKSKGGVCYEVILGQPAITVPPLKQNKQAPTAKKVSVDEIERKLCEAEKRRLELEAKKSAEWMAKKNRIEEASRKKNQANKEFSNQAKETLIAKMDNYGENREAIMADMKDKLKTQFQEIERTRMSMEQQKSIERVAIDKKLQTAANMRDENIKKMLERLKEHNKLASRANADARENQRAMEKLHIFENKLFLAEQNREKEIQKKLDSIRRHERHAEVVRQKALSSKVEPTESVAVACG